MASLMVFRKKSGIPSDTNFGDDIGTVAPGKTIVSENLSEQVTAGGLSYKTSVDFVESSTRVYLNGMYMTNGSDYVESGSRDLLFSSGHSRVFISEEFTTLSIVYSAK